MVYECIYSTVGGGGMVRFFYPSSFHSVVGAQRLFPNKTAVHGEFAMYWASF